jgi:hypothetical protein
MKPITLAVFAGSDESELNARLVRELGSEPRVRLRLPPATEHVWFDAILGEAGRLPDGDLPTRERVPEPAWLLGADALILTRVSPAATPLIIAALEAGIPVLALQSAAAEALVGMGGVLVEPGISGAEVLRRVAQALHDPAEQEARRRRGAAQLRRLRRTFSACVAPTEQTTPPADEPLTFPGAPPLRGVTVIIPTRGGARVRRATEAVRRAAGDLPLQIVCVVTGGLEGMLPPCEDVVRAEPPFCWAKANNAGLRVVWHPYVLLLNDDCYFLRSRDLERLVRRLEVCGHLIALAPRGSGFAPHWEQTTLPPETGIRETRFTVCGACVLIRREAFWTVGGFDERFTSYGCDEMDWFYRARAEGYRWGIDTEVSVEHEGSATYGPRAAAELSQSMALFRELHGLEGLDGPHWDPPLCAVSWVVASRNNAGHLARSLGSIAAQRHLYPEDLEVVLALDGPEDASVQVARSFNASQPEPLPLRIRVFPDAAGSPGRAKNRALRLARGKVHLLLDDDDAALPARAQLLPLLEAGADVAVGNFWVAGVDGSIVERRLGPVTPEHLLRPGAQNWGLWATAIRREVWAQYGMHSETLASTEDLELWLRWLRDGVRFTHLDVPVHLYLQRPGSTVFQHDTVRTEEAIREAFRAGNGTPPLGLQAQGPAMADKGGGR